MKHPEHLVKNQVLYQCHALCDGNLSIALQWIISVRLTIRHGQEMAAGGNYPEFPDSSSRDNAGLTSTLAQSTHLI
jgi:hypothetical protein